MPNVTLTSNVQNQISAAEDRLMHLHFMASPCKSAQAKISALEQKLVNYYAHGSAIATGKFLSLAEAACQIESLGEVQFCLAHALDDGYSADHFVGDEVVDWSRGRSDGDASRLTAEDIRPQLHAHICRVTGVNPAILHVQGGTATLDDGRSVVEARIPHWANPLGARRDVSDVVRDIETSTEDDFLTWLGRFDKDAVIGWTGSRLDCVMHRYYRQLTGVRWDCLRIDIDTASVESEFWINKAVTAWLPDFAQYVSSVTTDEPQTDARQIVTAGELQQMIARRAHRR